MRHNKQKRNFTFNTCITVTSEECRGDAEKMVRKFCKKVKKDGIVDEFRERTHFKKQTIVRAEKKRAKKRLIEKVNRRAKELLNPRSSRLRTRRN
jgi:ribosomal protein S21